jgi:hypothetical protein
MIARLAPAIAPRSRPTPSRPKSVPTVNMKTANPACASRFRLGSTSVGTIASNSQGASAPITDGPSTRPAMISPTTGG